MVKATLHCDGGCEPNPGIMGIGGHLTIDGVDVAEFSEAAGSGTNNQAEYLALIRGANLARQLNVTHLVVTMDSQLVVNQMTGLWRSKDADLAKLMREAKTVLRAFQGVSFEHILRAKNKQADLLATQGRTGKTGVTPVEKSARQSGATREDPTEMLRRIEEKLDLIIAKLDGAAD
jgi:ribonuclease H / adenosylcobalamin/alpha-ribazole phosphatase